MTTTVVNVRDLPDGWQADEQYVYVGRSRGDAPELDGRLGNPFTLRYEDERDSVLRRYQSYLDRKLATTPDFARRVEACRGKTLVCYCKPKRCHGDVIAAWLNGTEAP